MRTIVTVVLAAALAVPACAFAEDGPGGRLAGSLTASWTTAGWNGSVGVALDSGTAARDAAVKKIRSGPHRRTGNPFFTEGAHVTSLSSTQSSSYDCGNGDGSTGSATTTFGPLRDADTPFVVDVPFFDLLHNRGHISIYPVRDNYGDPLPESGRDFYPVPGQTDVQSISVSCIEGEPPASEDDVAQIWGAGNDHSAVPFGVPIFLESWEIPLRQKDGSWVASGTAHDPAPLGSVQTTVTYDLKLLGPMNSYAALCQVPTDADLNRARSSRAALAVVRKAGFPRARFAGAQPTRYHRHGHYFVDEKFSSSGLADCLTGRPRVFIAR